MMTCFAVELSYRLNSWNFFLWCWILSNLPCSFFVLKSSSSWFCVTTGTKAISSTILSIDNQIFILHISFLCVSQIVSCLLVLLLLASAIVRVYLIFNSSFALRDTLTKAKKKTSIYICVYVWNNETWKENKEKAKENKKRIYTDDIVSSRYMFTISSGLKIKKRMEKIHRMR